MIIHVILRSASKRHEARTSVPGLYVIVVFCCTGIEERVASNLSIVGVEAEVCEIRKENKIVESIRSTSAVHSR